MATQQEAAAAMEIEQNVTGSKPIESQPVSAPQHVYRSATDNSPLPLLAAEGPKHLVVYANSEFCSISSHTLDSLLGRPFAEMLPEGERKRYTALLDRVYHTGKTEALEDHEGFTFAPLSARWSFTAWAMLDPEARPFGVMVQARNVTDAVKFRNRAAATHGELLASLLRLQDVAEKTEELNAKLEFHASTDGLTGLRNHRMFQERLREEVDRSIRHNAPLSILLLDIDLFKQVNDLFGHIAGDAILGQIGAILSSTARHTDMVARYGGEEFAVILTETDAEGALIIAERFRLAIETAPWSQRPITVSIGIDTFSETANDPFSLIAGADRALYVSKRRGRNCVTSARETAAYSIESLEILEPLESMMVEMLDWHKKVLAADMDGDKVDRSELMVESWSRLIGLRDNDKRNHNKRVTETMTRFARAIGMDEESIQQVRWGAMLHEIGKIGVPDGILNKPGPLTEEEWVIVKRHISIAHRMLSPFSFLEGPALDIVRFHHENWSGTGYPGSTKGKDTPLPARMFAIVDTYDSLRSDCSYRQAWTEAETEDYLRSEAGNLFDPELVELFLTFVRV